MAEGRHRAADELASGALADAAGDSPLAAAAGIVAHQTRNHAFNVQQRVARQQAVVGTLASTETSHLPFADDQPMVYPRAPVWQTLSEKRAHFASADLRSTSPSEAKIRRQLQTSTKIEFIETPLQEAVAYLQDLHGIVIQLDHKALEEAALFADVPVTLAVDNVSLRTALRLLLRPLDLTYVVEDEVLMITTVDVASQKIVTTVYPLGDLLQPVTATSGLNGAPGGAATGFSMPGINGASGMPGGNPPNNPGLGLPF